MRLSEVTSIFTGKTINVRAIATIQGCLPAFWRQTTKQSSVDSRSLLGWQHDVAHLYGLLSKPSLYNVIKAACVGLVPIVSSLPQGEGAPETDKAESQSLEES